ncbi:type II toxin-antitoxin system RelE/ParE family toxin [Nocardia brasiliensis]|uniref:type II toxin-antitoxin system RelE/ParE family toxin n=1 Tax=Nocardia brasiliensis TaxID=37326 RepID=UPI001D010550|nr:type II toxin-antitoxin system RelE/ParE family toxin [Nocardia brasiliensis]
MADSGWDIYVVDEVRDWITQLDEPDYSRVVQAIDILADYGPGLGRPLVDTLTVRNCLT